ncbi:hypothetical protein AALP_AA3G301100 [Arabis alpina]|uniref:Protein LURP-one-related 6 n=1 Tax=Arabis alpina TaxID=50452 RepID=A0A087HCN1_ARAAL|nr:hypothetical protein AALP_AA3G301100 [Arabis alpina]
MKAVVSKLYCSSVEEEMVVRRRPHVVNGGGFVVTDRKENIVFKIDGCGVLGTKGDLVLRDGDGNDLLLIHKKGGIVQALSIHNKWRGYSYDYQGSPKPVFTLRDPKHSCFSIPSSIRISVQPENCYFDVRGYFPARDCSIIDSFGNVIAQVTEWNGSRDIYKVVIKANVDKAFVFGVIAVLDYIYGESTTC